MTNGYTGLACVMTRTPVPSLPLLGSSLVIGSGIDRAYFARPIPGQRHERSPHPASAGCGHRGVSEPCISFAKAGKYFSDKSPAHPALIAGSLITPPAR